MSGARRSDVPGVGEPDGGSHLSAGFARLREMGRTARPADRSASRSQRCRPGRLNRWTNRRGRTRSTRCGSSTRTADARIDRIARTARDLLGASGASVTFLDHERQWIKSAVSMSTSDTARAAFVLQHHDRDAPNCSSSRMPRRMTRSPTHPWVVGRGAGAFLRRLPGRGAERASASARSASSTPSRVASAGSEAALLRELALRVQVAALGRLTSERRAAVESASSRVAAPPYA